MAAHHPTKSEGEIDFVYKGETYHTYYKTFGNISDPSKVPLIILHGGPGIVHTVMLPHTDLYTKYDIPIILYDQIGNGNSSHLGDRPLEMITIELFVEELRNLIKFFGLEKGFDILGHSWGGMLGCEFAVRKQPPGLKRLIIANSLAAYDLWNRSNIQLLQSFPDDVKEGIMGGMNDRQKFYVAVKKFHAVHGCTVKPLPPDYVYSIDQLLGEDGDLTVGKASILQNWTIIDRLHLVRPQATLIINGRNDIAQDFVVKPFVDKIEKVKWVTFENSSHTPFFEERERYMEIVAGFLALKME